jgi:hypothetical protein
VKDLNAMLGDAVNRSAFEKQKRRTERKKTQSFLEREEEEKEQKCLKLKEDKAQTEKDYDEKKQQLQERMKELEEEKKKDLEAVDAKLMSVATTPYSRSFREEFPLTPSESPLLSLSRSRSRSRSMPPTPSLELETMAGPTPEGRGRSAHHQARSPPARHGDIQAFQALPASPRARTAPHAPPAPLIEHTWEQQALGLKVATCPKTGSVFVSTLTSLEVPELLGLFMVSVGEVNVAGLGQSAVIDIIKTAPRPLTIQFAKLLEVSNQEPNRNRNPTAS